MHDRIDVTLARQLYRRWRSWRDVAKIMRRPDGTHYTTEGVQQAVGRQRRRKARAR